MYIFSYYHPFNSISSLANYMSNLLSECKPRLAIALVGRSLLIVTSHTNCDVTSCPVVMRRYANADGDEQQYKTLKTQDSLAFCKIVIMVEYKLTTYMVCAGVVDRRPAQLVVVNSYNQSPILYMCICILSFMFIQ